MDKNKHYLEYSLSNLKGEKWLDIEGYEGLYQVSNKGRIKSLARQYKLNSHSSILLHERMMKFVMSNCGYLMVVISKRNEKQKSCTIHRLVAKAFLLNTDSLREVNHKNGIKWDNRVENLEWMTSSQNKKHGFKTGLYIPQLGESSGRSKLKEADVMKIRELNKSGQSGCSLARMFRVSQACVQDIISNKSWKHLLKAV